MKPKKKIKRGRKPVEDKKVHIPLYVPESKIELLAGRENVIAAAYNGIDQKITEINPNTNY